MNILELKDGTSVKNDISNITNLKPGNIELLVKKIMNEYFNEFITREKSLDYLNTIYKSTGKISIEMKKAVCYIYK